MTNFLLKFKSNFFVIFGFISFPVQIQVTPTYKSKYASHSNYVTIQRSTHFRSLGYQCFQLFFIFPLDMFFPL